MRELKPMTEGYLDLITGSNEAIQVELQPRRENEVLYVHVNGVTVLRILAFKNSISGVCDDN